jgi:transposase
MRTTIATHALLPKGLYLENPSIETGRVSISAVSGTRRLRCPPCGRGSSRVHSRYSRTVSDLPWHGLSVESRKSTWGGCVKPMEPSPMPGG